MGLSSSVGGKKKDKDKMLVPSSEPSRNANVPAGKTWAQ